MRYIGFRGYNEKVHHAMNNLRNVMKIIRFKLLQISIISVGGIKAE